MNYYLYMHENNINLIFDISSIFYTYLILKFYYLVLQQKNILCIRVTNTLSSYSILKIVQLVIIIAWIVFYLLNLDSCNKKH